MPLRIKCRCGQELVLRFNEWVHALFGLLVVSLLVNGTALVLLVIKLGGLNIEDEKAQENGAVQVEEPAPEAPAELVSPRTTQLEKGTPKSTASPQELISPQESAESPSDSSPSDSPESSAIISEASPKGEEPVMNSGTNKPPPAEAPESEEAQPDHSDPIPAGSETSTQVSRATRPSLQLFPAKVLPLERFLALQKSDELLLILAFLLDQDPIIRRRALEKCLDLPNPSGAAPFRKHLAVALPAAPLISSTPGGSDLLERLAGKRLPSDTSSWWAWGRDTLKIDAALGPPEAAWRPLSMRAEILLKSSEASEAIGSFFELEKAKGSSGVDVLIAIDSTESMEGPLKILSKSEWLFSALAWAIPDLRMGLLYYGDEVVGSVGLGADQEELSRSLSGMKAEGGGDVPEGVHEALRAALQLGRFDWRPRAMKQIVFVGDGPPPRIEVPSLLSLARECHAEGGYRIHAISVNPTEGRTATLYFSELAEAGGGKSATAKEDRIAEEVFLVLFPDPAREELLGLLSFFRRSGQPDK